MVLLDAWVGHRRLNPRPLAESASNRPRRCGFGVRAPTPAPQSPRAKQPSTGSSRRPGPGVVHVESTQLTQRVSQFNEFFSHCETASVAKRRMSPTCTCRVRLVLRMNNSAFAINALRAATVESICGRAANSSGVGYGKLASSPCRAGGTPHRHRALALRRRCWGDLNCEKRSETAPVEGRLLRPAQRVVVNRRQVGLKHALQPPRPEGRVSDICVDEQRRPRSRIERL